jgi:hypothetical protein
MTLLFILLGAVLFWIARTSRQDAAGLWRATALAVGACVLLVPTAMHPWYVLWVVPFLCFSPSPALLFFSAVVTLSYTQYLVEPETLPWWVWLAEYAPFYALLVWEWSTGRFGPVASTGRAVGPGVVATGAPRATGVTPR